MVSIEDRKKYELYRHHAWAGLGLLSIFIAFRYFIFIPAIISIPIFAILSIYILVALAFTYKYSSALSAEEEINKTSLKTEKAKLKLEKAKLKLEKKRIKAELKAKKKEMKKEKEK